MNNIEKQVSLGRSLYQINTNTLSEMAELGRKNFEQYFEVNRSFGEKLPEVRELGSFLGLQREYGETLWNNAREAMESQSAILQSAFSDARDAIQAAFSAKDEVEVVAEVAAPKTGAKKAKAKPTDA